MMKKNKNKPLFLKMAEVPLSAKRMRKGEVPLQTLLIALLPRNEHVPFALFLQRKRKRERAHAHRRA
jgi:hypothetical protein